MPSLASSGPDTSAISVGLRELSQLFNSMDPSPFVDRDLDRDAEEFIVSWARELPSQHELKLVINLATPAPAERAAMTRDAVQHYFAERAASKRREFHQLMRRGRVSLIIGLLFLTACIFVANLFEKLGVSPLSGILKESVIILGWVAMWRPLEIYLYDWWPLRADWRIMQRLSRMKVELVPPV